MRSWADQRKEKSKTVVAMFTKSFSVECRATQKHHVRGLRFMQFAYYGFIVFSVIVMALVQTSATVSTLLDLILRVHRQSASVVRHTTQEQSAKARVRTCAVSLL